ncbi:MAG: glycoside hydrolase family 2 TIM barrel-domain containing protein, partial [Armatimonadota bacterium]
MSQQSSPDDLGESRCFRSVVHIAQRGGRYVLLRNGESFFVKGAVGNLHLERLVSAGGNAIRAGAADLDRAHALGLAVLVGLRAGKTRWGFDYTDPAQVQRQLEDVLAVVDQHKNHPALLMWAIGNELELLTTQEQRVPVWRAVNQLAEEIKRVDPAHPVITPIGGAYRSILHELDELCPAL